MATTTRVMKKKLLLAAALCLAAVVVSAAPKRADSCDFQAKVDTCVNQLEQLNIKKIAELDILTPAGKAFKAECCDQLRDMFGCFCPIRNEILKRTQIDIQGPFCPEDSRCQTE